MSDLIVDETVAGWQQWHDAREQWLAEPHGWLSLTALHWLTTEPHTQGDLPGVWWFDAEGVWVDAEDATLTLDGAPVAGRTRVADAAGAPAGSLAHGERRLELIARGEGNRGVRVRDPQAPSRTGFPGVPQFSYDPQWRVVGRFEPLAEEQAVAVGSAAPRVQHVRRILGHAVFDLDGTTHRLAVSGGHATQIAFRDGTSGAETFGLMRQLDVAPAADGTVVLDFNRAVNPPCSFSDYGTCPLPPAGNTLPVAVRAGEKTPIRTA